MERTTRWLLSLLACWLVSLLSSLQGQSGKQSSVFLLQWKESWTRLNLTKINQASSSFSSLKNCPVSLFQAEENWCCVLCAVVPGPVPPPGWELLDWCGRMAGHGEAQHHLPLLPGQLRLCCGYSQTPGPAESQMSKVRIWTVMFKYALRPGVRVQFQWGTGSSVSKTGWIKTH